MKNNALAVSGLLAANFLASCAGTAGKGTTGVPGRGTPQETVVISRYSCHDKSGAETFVTYVRIRESSGDATLEPAEARMSRLRFGELTGARRAAGDKCAVLPVTP